MLIVATDLNCVIYEIINGNIAEYFNADLKKCLAPLCTYSVVLRSCKNQYGPYDKGKTNVA